MNRGVVFLSVDDLLVIHRRMIAEFGGTGELRDRGLLESACGMPRACFDGEFLHEGLPEMAAAYLFHICCNHPFADGNKRTALAAAETFLLINNRELNATNEEVETLMLGVASGNRSKEEITEFFVWHVKHRKNG